MFPGLFVRQTKEVGSQDRWAIVAKWDPKV